jgi:hypothetical protein
MKIEVKYYYQLTKEQQAKVKKDFRENGGNSDYLNDKFYISELNAQVAIDEDCNLYDVKVFDPYHHVNAGDYLTVYIGPDGWSNWLYEYRDNAGNDVDTIMEDYDGELQEFDGAHQG